jgi:hypothetical protein
LIALSDISDPSRGTSILLYGEGTIDVVVDDDDLMPPYMISLSLIPYQ